MTNKSFPQIPLMPTCPKLNEEEEELLNAMGLVSLCVLILLVRWSI
jgi:hypothetical protein